MPSGTFRAIFQWVLTLGATLMKARLAWCCRAGPRESLRVPFPCHRGAFLRQAAKQLNQLTVGIRVGGCRRARQAVFAIGARAGVGRLFRGRWILFCFHTVVGVQRAFERFKRGGIQAPAVALRPSS